MNIEQYTARAIALGYAAGVNAADNEELPRRDVDLLALALYEFGEDHPGERHNYCAPNLSGEWADDMTPARLMAVLGLDAIADADECDDMCSAWEASAEHAYWARLSVRACEKC